MKKRIILKQDDELCIAVYHIGYSLQGESSVFILYTSDKKIVYSMVIDCYEENQCNMTDEILDKWGLQKKVNLFVWTHPHDDHSVGVTTIIEKYCNPETIIVTADVFNNRDAYTEVCQRNIDFINSLVFGKTVKKKWKINPLCHAFSPIDEIEFLGDNKLEKMEIKCISPLPNIGGVQGMYKNIDCNKISIGCVILLKMKEGYINFMFAGDMEKTNIEELIDEVERGEEIPRQYNYIKIPHHGSKNAIKMVEFLKPDDIIEKSEFASTSVYVHNKLPNKETINEYLKVVNKVACTSDIENENYGIGIVSQIYDLTANTVSNYFEGTAKLIGQ